MPVIIKPQPSLIGHITPPPLSTLLSLMSSTSPSDRHRPILRSSFANPPSATPHILPSSNDLVHTIPLAFQSDLHLTLRPDDIQLSILSQFTFYVTSHALALRSVFVSHQGKKPPILDITPATVHTCNVEAVARGFTVLVGESLVDGEMVGGWLLPEFSTTEEGDQAVDIVRR